MKKQIDEASRKADEGPHQIQGKVNERSVRQTLEHAFPGDEFEDNDVGQAGGDMIQRVKLASGASCGSISWEDKDTTGWSDTWLAKARKDQRDNNCDLVVIVTTTLRKSIDVLGFDRVDNVWITARRHAVPLAKALRQALIENHQLRIANQNRESKAERLFSYITTNEFHQRITAVVEAYVALSDCHEAEKHATQRHWAVRERQLETLLVGTARLYGDLQGIVGKSLAEVEALRLPMSSLSVAATVPIATLQGRHQSGRLTRRARRTDGSCYRSHKKPAAKAKG